MIWFPFKLSLRRLFYILIFCATLVTALIICLSQLDLDDYRHNLEQQLAKVLNQPVRMGKSSLTFSNGLALEVRDLEIGPVQEPVVNIPKITATLELEPLLDRRIVLKDVQLDAPQVVLLLPLQQHMPRGASHQLINNLGIDTLTIRDGQIKTLYRRDEEVIERFNLTDIQAVLSHWQPQTTGNLVVTGRLAEQDADFLLETTLPSSIDPAIWRHNNFATQLTIRNFSTAELPRIPGQAYPNAVNLTAKISGPPVLGTQFTADISGAETAEKLFSIAGTWTSSPGTDQLQELSGTLMGVPLSGELQLTRDARQNHLKGQLGISRLNITPTLLERWRIPRARELVSGELKKLSLNLDHHWPAGVKLTEIPRIDADIILSKLLWQSPDLQYLQDLSVALTLDKRRLQMRQGRLTLDGKVIDFEGVVEHPFLSPQLALTLASRVRTEDLQKYLDLPSGFTMSGPASLQLHLQGPPSRPDFDFRANLNGVGIDYSNVFAKQASLPARLEMAGQLAGHHVQLRHGSVRIGDQAITASGDFDFSQAPLNLALKIAPTDLQPLKSYSPLLKRFEVEGRIAAEVKISDGGWQGRCVLDNFGAHLTSILGKLKRTSGSIAFDNRGLIFTDLQAGLGESDFTVTGTLSDWQSPELILDVAGDNIRAHDLIFRNPELTLYDLAGHLVINGRGISFSPVNVRLEEGTVATVNGSVSDFSDPEVKLDIHGSKVDVLDVINLFIGPSQTPSSSPEKTIHHKPIIITVSADEGIIGGFRFQHAQGLITDTHEHFILAPLTFKNGEGEGTARVVFDRTAAQQPLKISGHVSNINASILHQDLFNKPGLITGNLDGDFFIQGNPDQGEFWHSARGGMHLKVKRGVLHKFHSLSKVFSLLNISQLFKGQLPDMDREGMPFNLMEASVKIAEGRAATEDLMIHSEAMNLSMVGWQGIVDNSMDFTLGVMPLGTVDKVITSIPIAGWVLAGENKAFLTAYFKVTGTGEDPKVTAVPVDSVSDTVLGIFRRTFGLPGKLIKDIRGLFETEPDKKTEP